MITIIKRFTDVIEEKLNVRRNNRLTDLEFNKHGKPITHFDNGGPGLTFHDGMKAANPTYVGVTEAIDRPLYDTMPVVSASTTNLDFFQTPQGQGSKTAMETSMRQAGILPSPEKFTVKRIGLLIESAVLADVVKILQQCLWTFSVNSKIYTQGPALYYPAGFGIYGQTTANDTSVVTNGVPGELGVRSLVYDIPLNPLDPFIGNITVYGSGSVGTRSIGSLTLTATTSILAVLQGPYERAI